MAAHHMCSTEQTNKLTCKVCNGIDGDAGWLLDIIDLIIICSINLL